MKMKRVSFKLSIIIGGVGGALLIAVVAIAQLSPNYDLRWWTLGSGVGARQSTNYQIADNAGQPFVGVAVSANYKAESGFIPGASAPISTPTPTISPTPTDEAGAVDDYEDDEECTRAKAISVGGGKQVRTFHDEGDVDWIKFSAQANRTYIIEVTNVGEKADAVLFLHDTCVAPPSDSGDNAFGSVVHMEWDATRNGDYFIELRQFDPNFFGDTANYELTVTVDDTPPSAPTNPRCVTISTTTLGVQWQRSPERDVRRYRVNFRNQANTFSGSDDVLGGDTTYYELEGLTPSETYLMRMLALDFSGNESALSGEISCTATDPPDTAGPTLTVQQPGSAGVYTTTATLMTFSGQAQDASNNLSRVLVKNVTKGIDGWDYTLSSGNDDFRIKDLALGVGDNVIEVTAYDEANNTTTQSLTVRRLGESPGAVIIVAGHDEDFGLATNIYFAANRAYRIFQSSGFSADDIYYIAPVDLDADNDGAHDTDATATVANVQQAIDVWARTRVGPDKPLFMYWFDHGSTEVFCVNGCDTGEIVSPQMLDGWLRTLEEETGLTEVNVIIEACRSGGFINRAAVEDSISKDGRVVITSAGWNNNAYASAQGAYFSDAFFSCIADSGSLKSCFDHANAAVLVAGNSQTPMLDDNGDAVSNSDDGTVAQQRYITRFFASASPSIQSVNVTANGADGLLRATVNEGAEPLELVWASVYPPDFVEPIDPTLNLNVPVVRLEPVDGEPGVYLTDYINGFTQAPPSDYRIVFYAQDRLGINALPKRFGAETNTVHLPLVAR